MIFVDDDSPDGTYSHLRELSKKWANIRCLQRINRRGLSSACIEGMLSSSADFIAVMDGDLQHDESILPEMLSTIRAGNLDLVVGSRFVDGGSTGELTSDRVKVSNFATLLSKLAVKVELSDPMSGFFMISRSFFEKNVRNLSGIGFKILLDLIASSGTPPAFAEVPYRMRKRDRGASKLEPIVVWEYILLLIDKTVGQWISVRFVMFVSIGLTGVGVHLGVLALFLNLLNYSFIVSQSVATGIAMTTNYIFNNLFTYKDKRHTGFQFFRGLVSFYIACSIGFIINIELADFLFGLHVPWWLSGFLGAVLGSIWNYGATRCFTWR